MSHFDIISAQPNAWSILSRSYSGDRVASTYLLCGQEGLGHLPLALTFAALLNCSQPVKTGDPERPLKPCLGCRNCRTILDLNFEGLHPVLPIPSHKNMSEAIDMTSEALGRLRKEPFGLLTSSATLSIPISMAREIARRLSRKGDPDIIRVVLFYQMEKMKTASADALLKLIEEPPADTVIILTADRPERLLPTIQSRAQKIRLNRLPENAVVDYLVEKYQIPQGRATLLSRLSEGVLGRAIEMADEADEAGSGQRGLAMELFRAMFVQPGPDAVELIGQKVNPRNRGDAEQLLKLWQSLARDAHYLAVSGDDKQLINVDFADELGELKSVFVDPHRTCQVIEALKNALADFGLNVHIHTALAALSFKLKSVAVAAN